ncbi:CGNR zinc finger domain-containing protein [Paenibacillus donghaensis]|uniref:Zinc finger CGNR domain-containing protein n=1 Tax=Paenibacillus donghaensis TaxID=414771 RepID=A0A2Z2K4Y7_9BACL|nr:CGNR zinc finger domain-containing protein [Paenibacillus donghaensis]ASA19494.1 hypothetical protein B9T62_00690 [Paenibacillus donghaensis]
MPWEDFINSYWRDWRSGDRSKDQDKLTDADWITNWLQKIQLEAAGMPDVEVLEQLRTLRALMLRLVQQLVEGTWPGREQLELLNPYMGQGPVVRQLAWAPTGEAELQLQPQRSGWEQVMAEVAASFAAALLDKESSRFRICDNPDCLWVYYDDTRNRSKRYCDDKACGNLMKVRRFRARKKAEADGSPGTTTTNATTEP